MVEHLKYAGTTHSSSDLLKNFVKMGAGWSPLVLKDAGDTLSGPGAFLLLFSLKTWRTSSSLFPVQVWGRGGLLEVLMVVWRGVQRGGMLEVLMVVWRGVQGWCGVFYQIYSKSN